MKARLPPLCAAPARHGVCPCPALIVVRVAERRYCPSCSSRRRALARLEEDNSIDKILDDRPRAIGASSWGGGPGGASQAGVALPAADKDSASPASVRKRLGSLQSESDELEYLCKFKGRAHIHSRWLSAQEIVADGRLSAQRLGNYEKKKLAGELDRFNEQCLTVERVLAVDGGAGAKRKGGPDGAVPGAIDAGDSQYRAP